MRNYLLVLRFDGSAFHGSQIQPGLDTVQGSLENALSVILREQIRITACSRTDTGVHANMFCVNFRTDKDIEERRFLYSLNSLLPSSVSAYSCSVVDNDFHARNSCVKKRYIYKIWNGEQRNPFFEKYAFHFMRRIDEKMLDNQAKSYVGTHDFTSFCASGGTTVTNVRTIYDCSVYREGDMVIFSVTGDGFLYNMVRIMVGTLLDISDGKIQLDTIKDIIESKDRGRAGITAKPTGLYLDEVYYS